MRNPLINVFELEHGLCGSWQGQGLRV